MDKIAAVNHGRSPYSEINGAIAEQHGAELARGRGEVVIQEPGKTSAPGPDYVTYEPKERTILAYDAKYRREGGSFPSEPSLHHKLEKWMPDIRAAVAAMPEGPLKDAASAALKARRVQICLFKYMGQGTKRAP